MGALTALDVIVLLLVLGAGALGLMRGFVTEVLSLFAWVAVVIALKFLHAPVTAGLSHLVGTRGGAAVLAFAVVAVVVFVSGRLLANALGQRTRQSILGPLDRVLGLLFGALKGLIGATLLYLLATLGYDTVYGASAARPAWLVESRTYPLLNATGRAVVDFVQARREAGAKPPPPAEPR